MTIQHVRNISISFFSLILIISVMTGCESSGDSTITASHFNRTPGSLSSAIIGNDSLGVSTTFQYDIGEYSNFFAGSYETIEAFAVFKFSRPGQTVIDSLESATVTLTVRDVWGEDLPAYGLYTTTTDWDESVRLDSDTFLTGLGAPIDTFTDTTTSISRLVFDLPVDTFNNWESEGAFLLKGMSGTSSLSYLSSDNSTSAPTMKLFTRTSSADIDSTTIQSNEGTYCIIDGLEDSKPVFSNGNAEGYVLNITIPVLHENPTPVNQSLIRFNLGDHLFVDTSMTIMMYRLSGEFTTIDDAETDLSNTINFIVSNDSTTYDVDISSFVNSWVNFDKPNYGILVKPLNIGTAPDFAVLTPADSLTITYTTLPEVE